MGEGRVSRKEFIRLGGALGLGVAGSSVLAACGRQQGGQEGEQGGQETTAAGAKEATRAASATSTTSPTVEPGGVIVEEAFIPPGFAFAFNLAERGAPTPAVLVHLQDGDWVAYSAVCTHKGCEVGYQLQTRRLGCPCHGSIFDPAQGGQVVQGPAKQPLVEIEVQTTDGNVVRA